MKKLLNLIAIFLLISSLAGQAHATQASFRFAVVMPNVVTLNKDIVDVNNVNEYEVKQNEELVFEEIVRNNQNVLIKTLVVK